jgi:glycosyltransferase involved in cell wall biosynthesis
LTVDVLVDAFSHRFGGGVTYLTGLLPAIAEQPGIGRVRVLVEPHSAVADRLDGTGVELELVRLRPAGGVAPRIAWEALALPRRAGRAVVLAPAGMLPRRLDAPVLAVPHNLLPFTEADPWNRLQRRAILRTLGWAAAAIFVTAHLRSTVAAKGPIPPIERVVPHGLDDAFLTGDSSTGGRRGIVSVADGYPHKRLGLLVEAWRRLGQERPPLRIIGRPMAATPAPGPGLSIEDGLAPAAVADALRSAQLMVLPSVRESFGFPAIEALACGTPVLASDIGAYREVTGGHARLLASDDPQAWAGRIAEMLEAPPPPRTATDWGRAFTWSRCATATAEVVLAAAAASRR